jgi:hypothetical protein
MADQIFMFITTAGTMAALTALLFISRGIRTRSSGINTRSTSSVSSGDDKKRYDNTGKKVKKYSSDGKPIYED